MINLEKEQYEVVNSGIKYVIIGGTALNLLLPGIGAWYNLHPGEAGVIKRGGKYLDTHYNVQEGDSSFNWKMPKLLLGMLPGDDVSIVDVKKPHRLTIGFKEVVEESGGLFGGEVDISKPVKYEDAPEAENRMITSDVEFVIPNFVIQYTVRDPAGYLFNFDDVDALLTSVYAAEMRMEAASNEADPIMNVKRAEIGYNVQKMLQKAADTYGVGVDITVARIQDVRRPTQQVDVDWAGTPVKISVQEAYDSVSKAEKTMGVLMSEGDAQAVKRIKAAETTRDNYKIQGDTYYARVVGSASADTEKLRKYLEAFEKTEDTSRKRLYLETMVDIVKSADNIVVQKDGSQLTFVPVDTAKR